MRTGLRLIACAERTKNSRVSVCIQYVEIVNLSISANFLLEILKCACVSYYVCVCVISLHSTCEIAVAFSSAFSFASHGWAKKNIHHCYAGFEEMFWILNFDANLNVIYDVTLSHVKTSHCKWIFSSSFPAIFEYSRCVCSDAISLSWQE